MEDIQMKKILCALLLASCVMLSCAFADGPEAQGKESAENMLTEVYGYTVEEIRDFQYETTLEDGKLNVRFWPAMRPGWVYTASFDADTSQFVEGTSPFTQGMYLPDAYPGESAVREVLRKADEDNWFRYWNSSDRNELHKLMKKMDIQPTTALLEGVITGNISGGKAVHAFFESCYGTEVGWTQPVREWYERTLLLNNVQADHKPSFTEGIVTYTYQPTDSHVPVTVTRFAGEAPDVVKEMLRNPNLSGWQPVCGALEESPTTDTMLRLRDQGMLVFEKDGQRLLVALSREEGETEWTMQPISTTAIRTNVDMYIEPGSMLRSYSIVYPLSETGAERFLVRTGTRRMESMEGVGCSLLEYSRVNTATGEGFWLDIHSGGISKAVVYHADGRVQEEEISAHLPYSMEWLDVDTFPTNLMQCWQYKAEEIPDGYAVSSGVHLRATTSSRGRDLGMYESGVLVKILSEEPGDPYTWYRVQVGSQQGYMCSIYVDTDDQSYSSNRPPIGRTTKEIKLKKSSGWLGGTVQTLPEGTNLYILADCGDKLHVMLMEEENTHMPVKGTDGYVPQDAVTIAFTPLQLNWQ